MIPERIVSLTLTFAGLFVAGTLASLALFRWDTKRFFRSSLFIKICLWIPIYISFLVILYGPNWLFSLVSCLILIFAIKEYMNNHAGSIAARLYFLCFVVFLLHMASYFYLVTPRSSAESLLIIICFASVMSDVFAYFFGTVFGNHKLPRWINPRKSYEGVLGQIIGAFAGYAVVIPYVNSVPLLLIFIIGAASAIGDIANSIAKRSLAIKDWGNTLPGHGGVLDRFSSLGCAIFIVVWMHWLFV